MATQHLQHRHQSRDEIAVRVCDIFAEVTGIDRRKITPESALIEDLHCDSLRFLEVLFELERAFGMSFADVSAKSNISGPSAELFKTLFTRPRLHVSHMIEMIYISQGTEPAKQNPRPNPDNNPSKQPETTESQTPNRPTFRHLNRDEITNRVIDIFVEMTGVERQTITPEWAIDRDYKGDAVDFVEIMVQLEDAFDLQIPDEPSYFPPGPTQKYKTLFSRGPVRVCDVVDFMYIAQGTRPPRPPSKPWFSFFRRKPATPPPPPVPPAARHFTQLDGRWNADEDRGQPLLEDAGAVNSLRQFRRRSDGMLCVQIPPNSVEIGSDVPGVANTDEQPRHYVELDSFIIDMEPVSTTAYCRFLNSIPEVSPETLADWFVLQPGDDRVAHMLIEKTEKGWRPLVGTERWPMILVSWYGANAYSLWANRHDWRDYRAEATMDNACLLPSEAQWEYAARGAKYREFPWGEESPTPQLLQVARHERRTTYQATTLPLANVNEPLGVSPFGLHHMAGNVWQWCRDWYSPTFYHHPEANLANPENRTPTGVRSERGGSWVGTAELCRSSYRRGRATFARGRCLGFRCLSDRRR